MTSGERPTSSITVTLENPGEANSYIRVRYSNKGIAQLGSTRDRGNLEVLLDFKTPYDLKPATYDDVLLFDLCTDATCSSSVGAASITVPVQYSVLAPSPGQAPTVALSAASLNLEALITDAVAPGVSDLALTFSGLQATPSVTGTDASTPFAGNLRESTRALYALEADASGARIERQVGAPNLARRVQFGAGLVYTDGGVLHDPMTLATIGVLSVRPADAYNDVTTIDASGNRAFLMWNWMDPGNSAGERSRHLTSFDLASRTPVATIPLHERWHPFKIVRWGTNGLALLAIVPFDLRVILTDGAFVSP